MERHYYNLKLLKPFLAASEQGFKEINRLTSNRLSDIYLNKSYFKFTPVLFQWMFLKSIKK